MPEEGRAAADALPTPGPTHGGKEPVPDRKEMQPQVLPLEPIIEENSVIKESPPQVTAKISTKTTVQAKVTSPTKLNASRKRSSDGFNKKRNGTPKGVKYTSPTRRYPDMTETERKLAESDAYLRQIH